MSEAKFKKKKVGSCVPLNQEPGVTREGKSVRGTRLKPLMLLGLSILLLLTMGIDWTVYRQSYPMFSSGSRDFKDINQLVERLRNADESDPISRYLWKSFTPETREKLAANPIPRQLQEELIADEFNRILDGGVSLYSDAMFPHDLETYTIKLMDGAITLDQLPTKTNRTAIIARVYPSPDERDKESWRCRIFDSEGKHLDFDEKWHPDWRNQLANMNETSDLNDILGYTGLDYHLDRYKRDNVLKRGGEIRILNRLLLEHAFPDELRDQQARAKDRGFWREFGEGVGSYLDAGSQAMNNDVPVFLHSQIYTIWILSLCALIPGIAGMIYRRAFWPWFIIAFVLLGCINWLFSALGWGEIGQDLLDQIRGPYRLYLWYEALLVLLLLAFSLSRHSAEEIDKKAKAGAIVFSALLVLIALISVKLSWFSLLAIIGAFILIRIAWSTITQTLRQVADQSAKGKNIVICIDGTWNQPGQRDYGYLAETNVFKLYKMLKATAPRKNTNASLCKDYRDEESGAIKQVAFYYNGVGNKVENSQLGQLFGGMFGMGADALAERAYLDFVRVYRPGDRVFIVGFSRGAAIGRMLASMIGRRGVPTSLWTMRIFGRHWTVWKSPKKVQHGPEDPNDAYRQSKGLEADDVVIDVLGCWDTVGAFGISKDILGIPFQKINLLKDLNVTLSVKRAYHMLALDETRDSFEPTLMDPDPTDPNRIVEVWFSGIHANIGGGYATDRLSNVTLDFLLKFISSGYATEAGSTPGDETWGLYLCAKVEGVEVDGDEDDSIFTIKPDPSGRIRYSTGPQYTHLPRTLPLHAVIYDTVFQRMQHADPVYAPESIFILNQTLAEKRAAIKAHANKLAETNTIDLTESENMQTWSDMNLTIKKWSDYLQDETYDQVVMHDTIHTQFEQLDNTTIS